MKSRIAVAVLMACSAAAAALAQSPSSAFPRGNSLQAWQDPGLRAVLVKCQNDALFLVSRGLHSGVLQLEPTRKVLANSFRGEPLECVGGVLNDLSADSRGGVYVAISAAGVFYANPQGVVSQYGEGMAGANGIILSPDEKALYAIVFSGGWGTPSARNRVIAIPTIAQGYPGRAK